MKDVTKYKLMLCCILIIVAWYTYTYKIPLTADPPRTAAISLPSPTEFQGWINDILAEANLPLIKVDGQIGAETIKAYEVSYCYQSGQKAMEGEPK